MFDVVNQKGNSSSSLSAWVALIIPGARAHEAAASTSRRTVRRRKKPPLSPPSLFPHCRGEAVNALVVLGLRGGGELLQSLGDDAEALLELLLRDDQRRGKSDDVAVGWLGLHDDS